MKFWDRLYVKVSDKGYITFSGTENAVVYFVAESNDASYVTWDLGKIKDRGFSVTELSLKFQLAPDQLKKLEGRKIVFLDNMYFSPVPLKVRCSLCRK